MERKQTGSKWMGRKKKVYFMERNAFHVILNHQLNTVSFYFIPFCQSRSS